MSNTSKVSGGYISHLRCKVLRMDRASAAMETVFHVQNLHCNSCIRTIEESLYCLSPKPTLVDTSFYHKRVRIVHDPALQLRFLQRSLLDVGFDIRIEYSSAINDSINEDQHDKEILRGKSGTHGQFCHLCRKDYDDDLPCGRILENDPTATPHRFRLALAIGGMTCVSCVRTITDALTCIPGVHSISISLIECSGSCILDHDKLAELVRDAIEDCGYEVRIVSVDSECRNMSVTEKTPIRTVAFKVDGISSPQCVEKIVNAVKEMADQISIKKPPVFHLDPILVVSYAPKPPLSIRHIAKVIESSNNPPYKVTIHRPPTLTDLTKALQAREKRETLFRLVIAIIAAVPTFILGVVYMSLIEDGNPGKKFLMEPILAGNASRLVWALLFISTPVMFYSASIFHWNSIQEIRALWRKTSSATLLQRFTRFGSMNLLASSGISVSYISSLALLITSALNPRSNNPDNTTYFDAVVFLTMFLLIGRYIQSSGRSSTADAITALSSSQPAEALIVVPDSFLPTNLSLEETEKGTAKFYGSDGASQYPGTKVEKISVDFLEIGDIMCVPHGASPPADGTITQGEKSVFDESSLTGESRLVTKESGDMVYVGTINKGRMLHVRVASIPGSTMLDDIIKVVREGQTHSAPIERIADVVTAYFVPIITLLAVLTWLIWFILGYSSVLPKDYLDIKIGGWAVWSLQFSIAVFVVACPCGIGLAAPTAFLVGLGLASKHGILARGGGEAFQEMSQIDTIVFDKTGTITEGEPRVSDFVFFAKHTWNEGLVRRIAMEMETMSTHPLARAIQQYCSTEKGAVALKMSNFDEVVGRGLKAVFDELQCISVMGSEDWIQEHEVDLNDVRLHLEAWKSQGKSIVLIAICDQRGETQRKFNLAAAFAVTDMVRPEAAEVVTWYRDKGIETWMISGDNLKTAGVVASMVGIPSENVIAGVLPHEKSDKVKQLQQGFLSKKKPKTGRSIVAMVGDGVNDAPALSIADLGIAMGSGSDIAISSASFVLMSSNLRNLKTLRDLSEKVIKRVKFNFGWALMYNILAVPIAAGAIYPAKRARLNPVWASLAMGLSSWSVVVSSLLLKTYKAPVDAEETHAEVQ